LANWDKGEETRNGSLFESRKKVLGRKSYGPLGANDAKRDSLFATGKDKKSPGEGSGTRRGGSSEKNGTRLPSQKLGSKTQVLSSKLAWEIL